MKIPVFHDDQHGTAIVAAAALLNALEVVGKRIEDVKLVCSGAGAAAIACLNIVVGLGVRRENIWVTDSKGVVYRGRTASMDPQKERYAQDTRARTLAEIVPGADVFFGLSMAGVLKPEMVAQMADRPIILAMANPDPEIRPELAKEVRPDCIIATGRSRLSEPGQQRPVLPVHLPRRARRRRDHDQRGDEARLRARDRRARAGRRLGRGGRGLRPARHPLRARLPDPAAVRPAPDHERGARPWPRRR